MCYIAKKFLVCDSRYFYLLSLPTESRRFILAIGSNAIPILRPHYRAEDTDLLLVDIRVLSCSHKHCYKRGLVVITACYIYGMTFMYL